MRCLLLALIVNLSLVQALSAFTVDELMQDFDARRLSEDEKKFVQAALAFQGDYNGLLDGKWGPSSQAALERNYHSTGKIGPPLNATAVFLAINLWTRFDDEGWTQQFVPEIGMSFLVPLKAVKNGQDSDEFINLEHLKSSLSYSVTIADSNQMARLHGFTADRAVPNAEFYTVRRSDLNITSTADARGVLLYTRSDQQAENWSTIMLSANGQDLSLLTAVAGSIQKGRAPALYLPLDGIIFAGAKTLAELADQRADTTANAPADAAIEKSTGTGFFVSSEGHVLTNAHVVRGCSSLTVNGSPAHVVAIEDAFDLALVKANGPSPSVARFAAMPAALNSDVTVAGYPLEGLLSGLNITRGAVTAQKGVEGDPTRMQISAPVQAGNSGGPVLSALGDVVGVVVSKLDARYVADIYGDTPQNVNFAIRGEIAKLFLAGQGITVHLGEPQTQTPISPEVLAQRAAAFTTILRCN